MADPVALAEKAHRTNLRTLATIEELDAETAKRLTWLTPNGAPPNSIKQPHELAAWNAEVLATLTETVRDLARAQKNRQRAAARERNRAERARKREEEAS
jgi:hypothetical protein